MGESWTVVHRFRYVFLIMYLSASVDNTWFSDCGGDSMLTKAEKHRPVQLVSRAFSSLNFVRIYDAGKAIRRGNEHHSVRVKLEHSSHLRACLLERVILLCVCSTTSGQFYFGFVMKADRCVSFCMQLTASCYCLQSSCDFCPKNYFLSPRNYIHF
jgi:hypothetical protein